MYENFIGIFQSCSCSPQMVTSVHFAHHMISAACSRQTAFCMASLWSFSVARCRNIRCHFEDGFARELASISNPGVSPTSRLVTETSVLTTIIQSSITPHAIPGVSTSEGKQPGYVLGFCKWFSWYLFIQFQHPSTPACGYAEVTQLVHA